MHPDHHSRNQDPRSQNPDECLKRDRNLVKSHRVLSKAEEAFIQFESSSETFDWEEVGHSLDSLQQVKHFIPEEISVLLNRKFTCSDFTLLHFMIAHDAPTHLIHQIHRLGADMNARYSYCNEDLNIDLDYCSPLHLAAYSNNLEAAKTLLELGHDPCVEAEDGSTAMTFHLIGEHCDNKFIKMLRAEGLTLREHDLSYLVTKKQRKLFANLLADVVEDEYFHKDQEYRLYAREDVLHVPYERFVTDLKRMFYNLPPRARTEAIEIFARTQNIQSLADYTSAYTAATNKKAIVDTSNTNKAFAYLLSDLLFHCDPTDCSVLLRTVERLYDSYSEVHGHHPNEAEMLALCNHPLYAPQEMKNEDFGHVTAAATGITRFLKQRVDLSWDTVEVWGKIGTLSHSFLKWKFDAQRVWKRDRSRVVFPALLEEWGMQRIDADPKHGVGFVLKPNSKTIHILSGVREGNPHWEEFDSDTFFLFRHSHMLISHPERGTTLLRNSSPIFGRDKFSHPAYHSRLGIGAGYSAEDLKFLSDYDLKRDFLPILDLELNRDNERLLDIAFLVSLVQAIDSDYARWKFDTNYYSAWTVGAEQSFEDSLLGGFYSEGYESMVEWLSARQRHSKADDLPELAFVHPDYPPFHAYPFHITGESEPKRALSLDAEKIKLLKLHRDFNAPEEDLERTGIRNFFQLAGFDTKANLILRTPSNGQ